VLPSDITSVIDNLVTTLKSLNLEDLVIEDIRHHLTTALDALEDHDFAADGTVDALGFGTTATAADLHYHHGRAHEVMSETLAGTVADLQAYTANLNKSIKAMQDVDEGSAQELAITRSVIEQYTYLDGHSYGDRAYDHARNHPGSTTGG
jgi:hypothetical protein